MRSQGHLALGLLVQAVDYEETWIPKTSIAQGHKKYISATFGAEVRR